MKKKKKRIQKHAKSKTSAFPDYLFSTFHIINIKFSNGKKVFEKVIRTVQRTEARKKVLKKHPLNIASCQKAGRNVRVW